MRIKCIKTSVNDTSNRVLNGNMAEYLNINDLFWVYGIRFYTGIVYVYVFNGNHLFEVPLELFEVIDDKISDLWKAKIDDDGFALWPDLFYEKYFLENFSEREEKERAMFSDLRIKIEQ